MITPEKIKKHFAFTPERRKQLRQQYSDWQNFKRPDPLRPCDVWFLWALDALDEFDEPCSCHLGTLWFADEQGETLTQHGTFPPFTHCPWCGHPVKEKI